jgi:hypothetical protein
METKKRVEAQDKEEEAQAAAAQAAAAKAARAEAAKSAKAAKAEAAKAAEAAQAAKAAKAEAAKAATKRKAEEEASQHQLKKQADNIFDLERQLFLARKAVDELQQQQKHQQELEQKNLEQQKLQQPMNRNVNLGTSDDDKMDSADVLRALGITAEDLKQIIKGRKAGQIEGNIYFHKLEIVIIIIIIIIIVVVFYYNVEMSGNKFVPVAEDGKHVTNNFYYHSVGNPLQGCLGNSAVTNGILGNMPQHPFVPAMIPSYQPAGNAMHMVTPQHINFLGNPSITGSYFQPAPYVHQQTPSFITGGTSGNFMRIG